MGLYIKDMEMPKSCFNCKFPRACQAITRRIDEMVRTELFPQDHRHSDCPITEVPEPHGRLIDADKLADSFEPSDFWNPDAEDNCFAAVRIVHSASTVIPASVEAEWWKN